MKLVTILSLIILPLFATAQWKTMSVPTKANFRSVHAVNNQVAWVGGSLGNLYKTVNGGKSWNKIVIPGTDSLDFRDIHGLNRKEAIVLSIGESEKGQSRIYKTQDGGLTWKLVHQPIKKGIFLDCIEFWDQKNGICLGDPVDGSFYLLRTNDGGNTWLEVTSSNPPVSLKGEAAFAASGSTLHAFDKGKVVIGTGGNITYSRILLSED